MKKKGKAQSPPPAFAAALSVVIPTRNERDNIPALFSALAAALARIATEVVLVDDSDDDTPSVARACADRMASPLFRVTVIHRPRGTARAGGLATAVDVGLHQAQASYVAVIDADLQHPPERLRTLYDNALAHDADIVLATRYRAGGGYEGLDGPARKVISVGLKWVAKTVFPEKLLRVSDPLGGFFLVRRSLLAGITLRPIGYKISLEILLRCPWQRCVEVPYHFRARAAGASKSDMQQGIMVFRHMARLVGEVPTAARIWKVAAIAAGSALVNLTIFWLALHLSLPLLIGWLLGTESGILGSFALHQAFTGGDRTRHDVVKRVVTFHGGVAISTALNLVLFLGLGRVSHQWLAAQTLALVLSAGIDYVVSHHVIVLAAPFQRVSLPAQPQGLSVHAA